MLSRYDDVIEIEKNKAVFINSDKVKGGTRPNIPAEGSIIGNDDPLHLYEERKGCPADDVMSHWVSVERDSGGQVGRAGGRCV